MRTRLDDILKGTTTPSTWFKICDEDYWTLPALNHSSIKYIDESPAKYMWQLKHPRPPSPAQRIGQIIHKALLEPFDFDNVYSIQPKFDKRTKKGRELSENWTKDHIGKLPISEDEFSFAEHLINKVEKDSFYKQFFIGDIKEQVFLAYNDKYKLWTKCKVDNFLVSSNVIVDVKTTDNAQPHHFNVDITKYSYLTQAAWYFDIIASVQGKKPDAFVIIAVEKSRDNDMQAYYFDEYDISLGRKIYEGWLDVYVECRKSGNWHGYKRDFIKYKAPEWLLKKLGETNYE